MERRKIRNQAIKQAQRLAAIYDPTGASFNVEPVITLEDGTVLTRDEFRRRQDREPANAHSIQGNSTCTAGSQVHVSSEHCISQEDCRTSSGHPHSAEDSMNADRKAQLETDLTAKYRSKSQLKKLAKFAPRPPPPKPVIPSSAFLPEGEEDWLALWDLEDQELERRISKEKKRKAATRKALRVQQQSGKAERRMARDEKRRIYRDLKLEWRAIKGRRPWNRCVSSAEFHLRRDDT